MDIRDLFGEVRRTARQASDPRMQYALNRAARTFCKETWILRRQQELTCVIGQAEYAVIPPANEEAFAVKHAQLTQILPQGSTVALKFAYPTFLNPNINQQQQPISIVFVPYTKIVLSPGSPDKEYPVVLELVTQPIIDSAYVPDELGTKYDQALGYGALAWLLMQPANPWTDVQSAQFHRQLFNQEIIKARIEAAYDFTPNNRAWASPGFMRRQGRG